MHSFLLIGQSNMAGRGKKEEVHPIHNPSVYALRNGIFRPMYVPVNPDRKTSGICLAESFADRYATEKGVEVGLIPCADGGTCLDQWKVGGLLFDHACYMAELASRTSTIVGVLWHQGESDCGKNQYPFYEEKLTVILDAFRERLGLQDVPFLLGGLGDFLANREQSPSLKNYPHVNEALMRVAEKHEWIGFVSAEGLSCNADNLHFSSAALREFGERYYEEFLKLENKEKLIGDKEAEAPLGEFELL